MAATAGGGTRPAAVAGLFYPADPAQLRDQLAGFLTDRSRASEATEGTGGSGGAAGTAADLPAKAVIAPHAGYHYSGPTAGRAYRALLPRRGTVERVVIMGPAHRVRIDGVGLSTAGRWATPLGDVEIDQDACRRLAELPGVGPADAAHAPEHSVEVQLPFVYEVLGEVPVVPLLVGRTTVPAVARALDEVWGGEETAIVVSSDLSHYLEDDAARTRDRATAEAILECRSNDIGPYDACGCLPIGGLLDAAVGHGLTPRLLDLSTSADTAGEPSRVVGYGGFALLPPLELGEDDRRWLVDLAARVIDHELRDGEPYPLAEVEVPEALRAPGASFVTLQQGDKLLGCIGSLDRRRPLWRDVAHNARAAAFDDPRFPALDREDAAGMTVEVSVLSPLEEIPAPSAEAVIAALRPGVDGLLLAAEGRRATFLPDVWSKIPEPDSFVRELVRKARWTGSWSAAARAWRYTTHRTLQTD
jgi:AmmeMemoRadiSam system protein B/AmmeMemoRadiSam system protein A